MGQFERLLAYIKGMSRNTSEQGTWFENFMKHVFLTSPIYKEMYENVWMALLSYVLPASLSHHLFLLKN